MSLCHVLLRRKANHGHDLHDYTHFEFLLRSAQRLLSNKLIGERSRRYHHVAAQ